MTAPLLDLTLKVDQRALDRHLARLDKNRGKPLLVRAEKVTNSAAKLVVPRLRARLPASGRSTAVRQGPIAIIGRKRRKTMRQSAGTKLLRKRGMEAIRPTWIGSSHFAFGWLTLGTRMHHLQTRRLEGGPARGAGGRYLKHGRWTTPGPSNFGISSYRSGFAHFADGNVRPLAAIDVRGITGTDYVSPVWDSVRPEVMRLIEQGVFETF